MDESKVPTTPPTNPQPSITTPKAPNKLLYWIPRLVLLGIIAAPIIYMVGLYASVRATLPSMEEIERPKPVVSSEMYSADGKILGYIHQGENRITVDLDQISPNVINALIVTEDERFYEHSGLDGMAYPAILWNYLTKGEVRGASTISMQLARNLYKNIGREQSLTRKLKEAIVAMLLEKKFTKQEIIRAYLNTVNIYGNTYGIQTAAKRLFKKDAKDLTVPEAAMMVGMLKGQGVYDPYKDRDKEENEAKKRRNLVIDLMAKNNMVKPEQLDSMKKARIVLADELPDVEVDLAPYLKERVRLFMEEWGPMNGGYDVYKDGLKIYTTIDTRIQGYAEQAVKEHMAYLQPHFESNIRGREAWKNDPDMLKRLMKQSERWRNGKTSNKSESELTADFDKPVKMKIFTWAREQDTTMTPMDSIKHHSRYLESGMCVIDPQTGHVKAWVGGINYKHFKYDHVDLGKRQVGSTFKPFVYCAAIDNGRGPCERELNQPIFFYDKAGRVTWRPDNAGDDYGGYITLKKALEYSLNIITARLTKQLGIHVITDYAHLLGIKSPIEQQPASCLGTADLSVLEMTGAYSTFANKGVFTEPIYISRIEDKDGNLIVEMSADRRPAISEQTAFVMLEMLRGVLEDHYGTGAALKPTYGLSGDIGGKTGTTQDQSDGWFMGITSNLVAGTWVGCAERKMRFTSMEFGQGAKLAMPIFGKFYKKVQADKSLGIGASVFRKPTTGFVPYLDCDFEVPFTATLDGKMSSGAGTEIKKDNTGKTVQGNDTQGWE
jgi:penicillin-binding protein 1A